jgi:hypothetical protein
MLKINGFHFGPATSTSVSTDWTPSSQLTCGAHHAEKSLMKPRYKTVTFCKKVCFSLCRCRPCSQAVNFGTVNKIKLSSKLKNTDLEVQKWMYVSLRPKLLNGSVHFFQVNGLTAVPADLFEVTA